MTQKCKDIVVSGVRNLLIAPLGTAKADATDVGFTSGSVTFTAALEFTDVTVDQSFMPVRSILNAANYTFAAPLAGMNLDNLAIGLGVEFDNSGYASLVKERYYQVWFEADGPVGDNGRPTVHSYYIPKLRLGGTSEITFSRTDAQTANLEGTLINCPTSGKNLNFLQITEEEESESI